MENLRNILLLKSHKTRMTTSIMESSKTPSTHINQYSKKKQVNVKSNKNGNNFLLKIDLLTFW